ncbi:hypothetical protein VW35_05420 [Devosia soli]|uniref:Uncharacterized protein n=1 Tax=Devosia soli TaxID=361041 RepID=A0A0F5LCB0_9HYPH|nr:hypothetical protein [Devosia soli]KKB79915.1 hypothetical protein VW35_05420 [Devosia soli]
MKIIAILALTIACVSTAHAQGLKQFPNASETTPELIDLYEDANAVCRGASGNDVTTWANCAARSVYGTALNEQDWCFGKEDQAGAEMEWHECEASSLRFKPIDINAL